MAGGAPNADKFELYFKRADLDQDGRVSGAEAVSFFKASGLPTPVLAQIWTHVDQNRIGYLGRAEFYNYLKLVTIAQSKRDITPEIVKAALYGPNSAQILAPQINFGALAVSQPNLNAGSPALQMRGSAPVASHSISMSGPQGYSSWQAQGIRAHVPPLPNSTIQPQQSHGQPSGHTVVGPRPSTSSLFNDWLSERTGGPTLTVSSQVPSSGLSSKPNGHSFDASGTGAKDSSTPVAGTPSFQVPVPSSPGLTVLSSNGPIPAGTQFPVKSSQSSQINVAQQPTAGQNQKMPSTLKYNQQIPVQNSFTAPVGAENISFNRSSEPWPKMTRSNVQKYTKVFMEVDTDKDGKITGEQAHTLFLSWKLPRDILKQVWDLSDQDKDSMLSLQEFCIALYLMERYREGRPLPKVLPASLMFEGTPLPPSGQPHAAYGTPIWRSEPGVQQGQRMTAQVQASHAVARPPHPVPVPVPVPIDEDVQPKHQKRRIPVLEKHLVDQLSTEEQNSLNSKFQEATEADKKVGELEKDILEAKQKTEIYRSKMQELVLYKSRCDSRLNEITERVFADRREVESLSKKYEDKYKRAGDVASKLTIEEATFRDIQEKKMELYRAIVKLDQDGKPDDIQAQVDRIQADLEDQIKALNERSKMYGLRGKPTLLVELPFGWQVGIQGGAADWDENWDKFEDEGYTYVKELTLDVQNIIAPPKQKSLPVQNKSAFSTTTSSPSDTPNKSEKSPEVNESVEPHKDNSVETPTNSVKSEESPSKIFQDSSPSTIKTQSESIGTATFDNHYDSDSAWDFTDTNHQDVDQENSHGNMLFDSSDSWGLNPIRTNKSLIAFDSVPSTPAYSYVGSPPGNNLFHNQGSFASSFADSVPSTPAYGNAQRPFASVFSDSVPSTPMFDGPEDRSFNNLSRFDSFASNTPRDSFSRFDSFHSTAQDSESESNKGFFPKNFTRFDSMHSTADLDFGHSLFQPPKSFSRFDSMQNTSHGYPSFYDPEPFGSHDPFKTSFESETSRKDSVDGWKAF